MYTNLHMYAYNMYVSTAFVLYSHTNQHIYANNNSPSYINKHKQQGKNTLKKRLLNLSERNGEVFSEKVASS